MKVPCEVVEDLLPLYCDGLCSHITDEVVETHLKECQACRERIKKIKEVDTMLAKPEDLEQEALSQRDWMVIKTIKNQLRKKQLLTALISLGIACVVIVGGIWALSSSQVPITYEAGNVSVAEQDGRLYFQLTANRMYPIKDYLLLPADQTNESDALYFCFYTTHWDQVFGGDSLTLLTDQPFANETNLGQDKRISKIYYYTGDYTQLKNSVAAQQEQAVLLWREG